MATFEVFIPATEATGFNITARLKAESWIQALKMGLGKLGDTTDVQNIMVDFTGEGILVTEPKGGRVFKIREITDDAGAPPPTSAAPTAAPTVPPPPSPSVAQTPLVPLTAPVSPVVVPPLAAQPEAPAPVVHPKAKVSAPPPPAPSAPRPKPRIGAPPPAVKAAPPAKAVKAAPAAPPEAPMTPPPASTVASDKRRITGSWVVGPERFKVTEAVEIVSQTPPSPRDASLFTRPQAAKAAPMDDILAELFERSQDVYLHANDVAGASTFFLDLAMAKVPSDSGSVFIADISSHDLYFTAARGPKADDVMKFRVPMGVGIVGFSALDAVSLAISDVKSDPRFYKDISEKLGYETRSILCCPIEKSGRVFGAIELINRKDGDKYTTVEMNIINYLAQQMADYLVNTDAATV